MKKKFLTLTPYVITLALDFYLLPFFIKDTGSAMFLMLCVMPVIAFISSVICGIRNGFNALLAASAFVLFIPTIFIYYNSSAWVYSIVYAVIVLIGSGIGGAFYNKR